MKNKLQKAVALSLLASFSFLSYGQEGDKKIKEKILDENGKPSLIVFKEGANLSSSNFQSILKENLNLKSGFTFQKIKEENDNLGFSHEKYQLFYNNVKIEFATYTINSKGGRIVSMNGEIYNPTKININPTISPNVALEAAKKATHSASFLWQKKRPLLVTQDL